MLDTNIKMYSILLVLAQLHGQSLHGSFHAFVILFLLVGRFMVMFVVFLCVYFFEEEEEEEERVRRDDPFDMAYSSSWSVSDVCVFSSF